MKRFPTVSYSLSQSCFTLFMTVLVLMFSLLLTPLAQQNSVLIEAIAAANADANKDVNKLLWFGSGCLVTGVAFLLKPNGYVVFPLGLVGYLYVPNPPPSRLIGKSSEFVDIYTKTYIRKRGQVQANLMGAGCLGGCITIAAAGGGIVFGIGARAATQ